MDDDNDHEGSDEDANEGNYGPCPREACYAELGMPFPNHAVETARLLYDMLRYNI